MDLSMIAVALDLASSWLIMNFNSYAKLAVFFIIPVLIYFFYEHEPTYIYIYIYINIYLILRLTKRKKSLEKERFFGKEH